MSTQRVDDLVQALGLHGMSKSQVSRICQELDAEVERFQNRSFDGPPYVYLDATFVKVRQDHRVVSQAIVIAIGVRASGERDEPPRLSGRQCLLRHCHLGRGKRIVVGRFSGLRGR
ncbi:MAG: transposase [Chloroflexota bacterium]